MTVAPEATVTVSLADEPVSDPIGLLLTKRVKNGVEVRHVG